MSRRNRQNHLHPNRHMNQFGARPGLRRKTIDVATIEVLRESPDHPAVGKLIDDLLKLRKRSTLPLDVRAILERHGR